MIEFETDDRLGLGEFGIQTRVVQPEHESAGAAAAGRSQSGRTMIYSTAGRVAEPLEERARARQQTALLMIDGKRLVVGPAGVDARPQPRSATSCSTTRTSPASTPRSALGAARGC